MAGRLRWLGAALFAALWFLLPSPRSNERARSGSSFLQVRQWLLGPESPLAGCVQDGRLGPLRVELRQSPPITDEALRDRTTAEYARSASEWAAARQAEGRAITFAATAQQSELLVRVGDAGARAVLVRPDGSSAFFDAVHGTRLCLLPSFLAIVLAILTARVLPSLLLGCLAGSIAWVVTFGPEASGLGIPGAALAGVRHFAIDTLWARVVLDAGNLRVAGAALFLFLIASVMAQSGIVQGIIGWTSRCARGPVGSQLCSCLFGIAICFDDLMSRLFVGTAMQPLTDRGRVSREKLAWIVDATGAPAAGLSICSTWDAGELAQYRAPLTLVARPDGTPYAQSDALPVFVQTIPYRFYCVFTLVLVLLVIVLRRDCGPMLLAERRARLMDGLWLAPHRRSLAILPGALRALRTLAPGLSILFLAWTLGKVCEDLGTSFFLTAASTDLTGAAALPLALFSTAALVSFATGTIHGAMAILLPNVVVLAHRIGTDAAFGGSAAGGGPALMVLAIAAVLEGSIFGRHCSPVGSTTVLSSLGSRCDHLAHVRTQVPYALLAMATACLFGYLPMVLLGPAWWPLALGAGTTAMAAWLCLFGRDPARPTTAACPT